MAFCIECGAKAPAVAKFCPQCGSSLVLAEQPEETPAAAEADPKIETPKEVETETVETPVVEAEAKPEPIKVPLESELSAEAPSAAASIAAAANLVEDAPKSKSGILIGLSLAALIAAGGGAYMLGLFGGGETDVKQQVSTPVKTAPEDLAKTQPAGTETSSSDSIQTAYGKAIKSGRISDLGQFATDHSKSSLAKDAEAAAFASLQRQGSVLAFNTFKKYFPEADLTAYSGLRPNAEASIEAPADVVIELDTPQNFGQDDLNQVDVSQSDTPSPSIRFAITSRAEALEPFIAQGDTSYAMSVVDEMLGLPDLNEDEATYLLNLRGRVETTVGFAPAPEAEYIQPDQIAPLPNDLLPTEASPDDIATGFKPSQEPEIAAITAAVPAVSAAVVPDVIAPEITTSEVAAFDTPAKPIERFGAITPDTATEPGECDMTFSIGLSGSPTNVVANCTDPIFVDPAKEAVVEWTYSPALLTGNPVQQDGLTVKLKFHLEE